MLNIIKILLLTGPLLLCAPLFASALSSLDQVEFPDSFEKQSRTTKLINYLIDKSHFKQIDLNDEFSEQVMDRYIELLDPAKSFFLESDIKQFEAVKYEFDDYIKQGKLEPIFSIFEIYRTRVNQRIEFALTRLEQPFDFTLDEQFLVDREEANWALNEVELEDYWRKRIKNDIINLSLANKSMDESIETLSSRYTHIARRTRQFNADDVFQTFINAYVTTIEPHTSYYSPRGAENFKIHMRLSLEGIGAVLQTDNEYTLVRRIIPGGPADVSEKLHADDRIIGVGQEGEEIIDVIGWRLDDVVDLIRGPKASVVSLEILNGENGLDGEPEVITITRDKIKLEEQAASKKVINIDTGNTSAKMGIIQLPSFYSDFDGRNVNDPDYRSTTRDVRKLLSELQQDNVDGLIIDLRGNGGGALSEAVTLTGLFIRKGPVVQVQNTTGRVQIDRDPDPEIVYDGPLLVLVDRSSASASEIFAGAIQDYRRGLIVGESTFGKGTVQNLVNLNRFVNTDEDLGQLKVTIAQFFRVNGDSTQHRGVVPDLIWHTSEKETDSGERSYENAIPWKHIDQAAYIPFSAVVDNGALDRAVAAHQERTLGNPEFDYFLEVNRINRENRERNTITLNQQERKLNREQRDLERLSIENERRKASGQTIFEDVAGLDAEQEQRIRDVENNQRNDIDSDVFLVESAKILADFNFFSGNKSQNTATELVQKEDPVQSPELQNN